MEAAADGMAGVLTEPHQRCCARSNERTRMRRSARRRVEFAILRRARAPARGATFEPLAGPRRGATFERARDATTTRALGETDRPTRFHIGNSLGKSRPFSAVPFSALVQHLARLRPSRVHHQVCRCRQRTPGPVRVQSRRVLVGWTRAVQCTVST